MERGALSAPFGRPQRGEDRADVPYAWSALQPCERLYPGVLAGGRGSKIRLSRTWASGLGLERRCDRWLFLTFA